MKLNKVLYGIILIIFIFVIFETTVSIIPWYRMHSIEIIPPKNKKAHAPGELMRVIITRKSLISFEAHLTRELIKIGPNFDELVYQTHETYGVQPGLRKSALYLQIPTLTQAPGLSGNSYIWKGTMTYRPLGGPEKTVVFKSPKFHISIGALDP